MSTRSMVAIAALVTGCAASPRYAYRPTAQTKLADAPGDVAGAEAADYRVPRLAPRGDVKVATLGVTTTKLLDGRTVHALHVRLVVHNGAADVWMVDAGDQTLVLDGTARLQPVLARCDGDAMRLAVLEPGDTRTVDLYYELPAPITGAAAVPAAALDWRVTTTAGVIAHERSAFERHALPPPPVAPVDVGGIKKELAQSPAVLPSWRQ